MSEERRPTPETQKTAPIEATRRLWEMGLAYVYSQVLFTAIDLGLFDVLSRGAATSDELARHLTIHPEGCRRFLVALRQLGLVDSNQHYYTNSALGAYLTADSPYPLHGLSMVGGAFYRLCEYLPDALREYSPRWQQALGTGSLHAGATRLHAIEAFRLLAPPRHLERCVMIALPDAPGLWGRRGARTVRAPGAHPTDRLTAGNPDRGMAVSVRSLHPDDAPLPLRADRVCGVPVDHALGSREAVPSLPLPASIVHCRANKVSGVLRTTCPEVAGGHRAHIDDLCPRGELARGQVRLHGGQHGAIRGRGQAEERAEAGDLGDHTAMAAASTLLVSLVVGKRTHEPTQAVVYDAKHRLRPGHLPAICTEASEGDAAASLDAFGRHSPSPHPAASAGPVGLASAGPQAGPMGRGRNSLQGEGASGWRCGSCMGKHV